MASDAVDQLEWQRMLAEFKQHFWRNRAPAFEAAWLNCVNADPSMWGDDLKLSLHGLAGVAALVDQEVLGDMARAIEQRWDSEGASIELLPELHRLAAGLTVAAHDYALNGTLSDSETK